MVLFEGGWDRMGPQRPGRKMPFAIMAIFSPKIELTLLI